MLENETIAIHCAKSLELSTKIILTVNPGNYQVIPLGVHNTN